jgi:hypothetical protein
MLRGLEALGFIGVETGKLSLGRATTFWVDRRHSTVRDFSRVCRLQRYSLAVHLDLDCLTGWVAGRTSACAKFLQLDPQGTTEL